MLKYKCAIFLILISFFSFGNEDVDFDSSNGLDIMESIGISFDEPKSVSQHKLRLLRNNFENNQPSKVKYSNENIIPKTIHQIWLGGNPMPKNYQYYSETWKKFHPDWEYKLWQEDDIIKENFSSMDLYYKASSYQEKADIIRYEILKKYGGIYVDTDIECLKNFNEIVHKYKFFAGMESPVVNKFVVSIPNSLIGSIPNHPIIIKAINNLREGWNQAEQDFIKNFATSRDLYLRSMHFLAVQRSMYPFTNSVFDFLDNTDHSQERVVIFPAGYNTPIYFTERYPLKNKLRKLASKKLKFQSEIIIKPETMSFQHYGKENRSFYNSDANFESRLFNLNSMEATQFKKEREKDFLYLGFKDQFSRNFPLDNVTYNPQPPIPEAIYIYCNESDLKNSENLSSITDAWKNKNQFFTINLIDYEKLIEDLPTNVKKQPREIIEIIAPFYYIYKNGGVFVNTNAPPMHLNEFNYKFSFYGAFKKLDNPNKPLKINFGFLAFKKDHILIRNFIEQIEEHINNNKELNFIEIEKIYSKNFYFYNQLDGRNVVFPESVIKQKINKWVIK